MAEVVVSQRVGVRHPEISNDAAVTAWRGAIASARRLESEPANIVVAVGFDKDGRLLEVVAVLLDDGTVYIFHAMKATKKTLIELGLTGSR
ncbi:MAG: hypothetical protein FWD65_01585 [Coriobacteriia bacterium]|nr:hypothetical protein [Coriobacteriia bacterium]